MDEAYNKRKKEAERLEQKAIDCVFTMSASDYVASINERLSLYILKSVEAYEQYSYNHGVESFPPVSARAGLAKLCEELGAEAIVDVKPAIIPHGTGAYAGGDRLYLIGTALIPRKG